jgi:Ca2+-binding RTX toxin-like protein
VGGGGNTVLVGGGGVDTLTGGNARNVLVAGTGSSNTLNGGGERNLFIAGSTTFDAHELALTKILAEWSRPDADYASRLGHLRGTLSGGLNETFRLDSSTVLDNEVIDSINAGLGEDWFFADTDGLDTDLITDLQAGEQTDPI